MQVDQHAVENTAAVCAYNYVADAYAPPRKARREGRLNALVQALI